uniref:Uncharacterized protein n=1 Tax=Burkholderia sp. (strain CCGE1003) TaxID=640512 RepID=E1T674_BURSG
MSSLPYLYSFNGLPPLFPGHQSFASVNGGNPALEYQSIDQFLADRGIKPATYARYSVQREIVRRFMGSPGWPMDKDQQLSFVRAVIDLGMIWAVIATYRGVRKLPGDFRTALFRDDAGTPAGASSKGRDTLAEYYASARFKAAGCFVRREEPDIMCSFRGEEFGLAVKRFKPDNLERHVRKARDQIEKTKRPGVIVLDITQSCPMIHTPFHGTLEQLRAERDAWVDQHFFLPMRRNSKAWRLDQRKIPYVVCFHHCAGFLTDGSIARVSFMGNSGMLPLQKPSWRESAMIQTVHEAIEYARATLPEATP